MGVPEDSSALIYLLLPMVPLSPSQTPTVHLHRTLDARHYGKEIHCGFLEPNRFPLTMMATL